MARRKIWVTRSAPGAEATAQRVRALGFDTLVAPLLTLRPLEVPPIDLDGVAALAFTSAGGVRAFAGVSSDRALRVFAVGDATAAAAREAGFRTVLSTQGDVAAMASGIAARRRDLNGAILHPGAKEPAGDLAGALAAEGIEVRSLALYESVPAEVPPDVIAQLPKLYAVLLHSPKAARALAALLKSHPAPQLAAYCLSRAIARPLARAGLAKVAAVDTASEEALLNLIER